MTLVPLRFPPGIYRPGTKYDARGRWYDCNLVRWQDGAMQAVGGWQALEVSTPSVAQVDVGDRACGMLAWRANDQNPQLAVGTPTALYHFSGGVLTDITPVGFTAGNADAQLASALYGSGAYGVGVYGTGDPAQGALVEAQNWALDTFGEDLVACAYSDGLLYHWDKSAGGVAAVMAGAPVDCLGVVVTPERFVVALGAGGDGRLVQWADQESLTTWTPAATNQAGDFTLPGGGQLMAGRAAAGETLLWTDADLFVMRYVGGSFVYAFEKKGTACPAVSRRAMALVDGKAYWMGARKFFAYEGYTQALPCEVGDYVFGDFNRTQASKVWADVRSEFSEVTWHYPSSGATECDRYVTLNYAAGFWSVGETERTAGVDRAAFPYPIAADADGLVYQHEVGTSYTAPDGSTLTPYAESGPLEIGEGDHVMHVLGIVPDEKTLGGLDLSLVSSMYPTAAETTHGPYSAANPTDVRVTGRQVRLRAEQAVPGWRLGTVRLDVRPGGRR